MTHDILAGLFSEWLLSILRSEIVLNVVFFQIYPKTGCAPLSLVSYIP